MTTTALEIVTPVDEPLILTTRFVKAPPELVFRMFTEPEHLKNWLGPRYLEMVECEVDLRVGGSYRYVHRAPDGSEHAFHGVYREIDPPLRLSNTFVYEGWPDVESIDTLDLEAVDGGTLIRGTTVHPSIESRDQMVASGMEGGMTEGYERLDELLASLQA